MRSAWPKWKRQGPGWLARQTGPPLSAHISLIDKGLHTYDAAAKAKAFQAAVRQAGEDAMTIPLFRSAQANVMQPYAHSDYLKVHRQVWTSYRDWIEKRK